MEQEYSYLFVVLMGMGVTFIGLTAIIYLTLLMGKIITAYEKKHPQPTSPDKSSAPAAAVPQVASDGVDDYVKVAIIAALAQEPGFRMDRVTRIDIKRA